MCGITGIINLNGTVGELPRRIKNMTDILRHRGPDGEGFLFADGSTVITAFGKDTPDGIMASSLGYSPGISVDEVPESNFKVALGHRRLSIIDVSPAGHQPMCDPHKNAWIVYNGEIYNYIELREELKKKGVAFSTQTDTEVILQSYLAWGEECVKRFNGMWAFVIYDVRKNSLFGSRDRVGVKPFYFYKDARLFAFASEQKSLIRLFRELGIQTGIHPKAAAAFLAGDIQYIERGEENIFRNIFEVMPCQNFILDLSAPAFRKWSYYAFGARTSSTSFNENKFVTYREETERRLVNAVQLRLRSDVPLGSCLSGGIDSSAIVGIIGKLISKGEKINLGERLNVFTLTVNEKEIDESRWAQYVVDRVGAESNLVSPSAEELLHDLQDLNYAQDIPVCSTGTYGQFRLMRRAKERGIKVILDGQGGDELFAGYASHSLAFWRELFRKRRFSRLLSELSADGKYRFNQKLLGKELAREKLTAWTPYAVQRYFYKTYFAQHAFLTDRVIREYVNSEAPASEMEVAHAASLNEALLIDYARSRLKMYLKYEDRSSMWHSIEARTPFADDHLLSEYVFLVPGIYKIHGGINKYLLREAMRDYLPAEIKYRKDKLGFVTPINRWMLQIKDSLLDFLDDSVGDFIQVDKIRKRPDEFFAMRNHADGVRVFRMISFAVWKKKFQL